MSRGRQRRLVWLLAAAFTALLVLGATVGLVADLLWFQELGQAAVFWKLQGARALVRVSVAALYAAVLFVNLRLAAGSFGWRFRPLTSARPNPLTRWSEPAQ